MNKTASITLTEPQGLLNEMRETIRHHQSFQTLQDRFSLRAARLLGDANIKSNLKFATRHLTNPAIICSLMTLTLSSLKVKYYI